MVVVFAADVSTSDSGNSVTVTAGERPQEVSKIMI